MPSWQTDGNPDADIGANSFLGTRANDPLRIRTRANVNNADVMTITPAPDATTTGNVGIGTTSPERWRLTIQGGELISFKNTTGATKWHINDWNGSTLGSGDLNIAETGVADGRLYLKAGGNVGIGTTAPGARLHVMGDVQVSGDIRLEGADCAEDFDVSEAEEIEPGTVMVIDEGGALRQSQTAYDKMVVGVISNAGN